MCQDPQNENHLSVVVNGGNDPELVAADIEDTDRLAAVDFRQVGLAERRLYV